MNKKLGVILIVSLLIISLVGVAYALDFRRIFSRAPVPPATPPESASCNTNADCATGKICVDTNNDGTKECATLQVANRPGTAISPNCPVKYQIDMVQKDLRSIDNQATPDYTNLGVIRIRTIGLNDDGFRSSTSSNYITDRKPWRSEALYLAINRSMFGVWREEVGGSDLLPIAVNNTNNYVPLNAFADRLNTLKDFANLKYGLDLSLEYLVNNFGWDDNVLSLHAGDTLIFNFINTTETRLEIPDRDKISLEFTTPC